VKRKDRRGEGVLERRVRKDRKMEESGSG